MRISRYDRLMAIKRLPEFKKEYNEYNAYNNSNKRCQKAYEIEWKWGECVDAIMNAEKLQGLHKKAPQKSIKEVSSIHKKPMQIIYTRDGDTVIEDKTAVFGERLYLEIDITDTKTNLLREFESIVKKYQKILTTPAPAGVKTTKFEIIAGKHKKILPDKSRLRETETIDIWQVYDMKAKGKSLLQITQDIYNEKGSPGYGFKEHLHKRVKDANIKAEKIIKQVREEAKIRSNLS